MTDKLNLATKHFSANMITKKMKAATTEAEIKTAMSPFSREHESAFWEYLYGRAVRAMAKDAEIGGAEKIALMRKNGEHFNSVPCDNDKSTITSTIGCGDAILDDNLAVLSKVLDSNPGNGFSHVLTMITKHISTDQRQAVIDYIKAKAQRHVADGTNPLTQNDHIGVYEYWTTIPKPLPVIEAIPDIRADIKLPDNDEDERRTSATNVTTRTNIPFLVREMKVLAPAGEYIMDIHAMPPAELIDGLPKCFHPQEGPNPYGDVFGVRHGSTFLQMMDFLNNENVKASAKERALVVLMNYMNRFLLMDAGDKSVMRMTYNSRGQVEQIYTQTLDLFKDDMWICGDLCRKGENIFNLWKGMPYRARVYEKVNEPTTGPQRFIAPDGRSGRVNTFLGFKVELEHDLENWKLGTAVDEFGEIVDIQPIVRHIREHFAQGDDAAYRWLLKWFYSVIIKKQKTETAIILGGEQGCGKGLVINQLIGQGIIGGGNNGAYMQINGLNLLVGRFNGSTGGKILICGNEVDARTKHKSDALKEIITENTRNLEKKGKEAAEIRDFSNIIITTNNIDCIKIDETDRRYFIQDLPLPRMDAESRAQYFDDLSYSCQNPLSAPEFYVWLKNTVEGMPEIMTVNLRKIPYTKAKQTRILDDQHPMYRWLQERYVNNPSWSIGDIVIQYDLLRSFQTDELYKNLKTTSQQFTKMFEKLGFEAGPERHGRCWKMMSLEDFKSAMMACGKWNDTL